MRERCALAAMDGQRCIRIFLACDVGCDLCIELLHFHDPNLRRIRHSFILLRTHLRDDTSSVSSTPASPCSLAHSFCCEYCRLRFRSGTSRFHQRYGARACCQQSFARRSPNRDRIFPVPRDLLRVGIFICKSRHPGWPCSRRPPIDRRRTRRLTSCIGYRLTLLGNHHWVRCRNASVRVRFISPLIYLTINH